MLIAKRLTMTMRAIDHYFNGEPELRLISTICPAGKLAIDIGANIGVYTYFLQRRASQVHAFEPHPVLAARLRALFPRVTLHEEAVSDSEGEITLRVPVRDGRPSHELSSICQDFTDEAQVEEYRIRKTTIDAKDFRNVGFVKIDVEQHELAVLAGMMETVRRERPVILTEVCPLLYPASLPETFGHLLALGYEGHFRYGGRYLPFSAFVPETHANPDKWGKDFMGNNVIFSPVERALAIR